jgi:hypothetical protein
MAEPLRPYSTPVSNPPTEPEVSVRNQPELVRSDPGRTQEEFWLRAGKSYGHMRNAALNGVRAIRRSAAYLVEEKPVELIVSVAAAGFIVGAGLRMWRRKV